MKVNPETNASVPAKDERGKLAKGTNQSPKHWDSSSQPRSPRQNELRMTQSGAHMTPWSTSENLMRSSKLCAATPRWRHGEETETEKLKDTSRARCQTLAQNMNENQQKVSTLERQRGPSHRRQSFSNHSRTADAKPHGTNHHTTVGIMGTNRRNNRRHS